MDYTHNHSIVSITVNPAKGLLSPAQHCVIMSSDRNHIVLTLQLPSKLVHSVVDQFLENIDVLTSILSGKSLEGADASASKN